MVILETDGEENTVYAYKIMVVEDEPAIAQGIKAHLEKWGYQVELVEDFMNVTEEFVKQNPQLVLMDIGLPFYNGFYWCAQIRQLSKVPIVFVSSAQDNMNIVMAINMGGDDFISKPFEPEVLAAKVQAILRRAYAFHGETNVLAWKDVILNLSDANLMLGERKLELTKNEFKIMQLLLEHAGECVSREEMMKRLWDNECFVDDNTLTVNITRLRKKLEAEGRSELIQTKKGFGYCLESEG